MWDHYWRLVEALHGEHRFGEASVSPAHVHLLGRVGFSICGTVFVA